MSHGFTGVVIGIGSIFSIRRHSSIVISMQPLAIFPFGQTAVLVLFISLTACQTSGPILDGGLPGSGCMRPAPPINARDLMLVETTGTTFRITKGENLGATTQFSLKRQGDSWRAKLTGQNTVQMSVTAEGSIIANHEDDLENTVRVHYAPPLLLMPARLAMGQPAEGQSDVKIINLLDGTVRTRGRCRYRIELAGRQIVSTPAGQFDAFVVKTRREMDLGIANASITWRSAYVPGKGRVAHHLVKQVRLLGLIPTESTREIRLTR